MRFLVTNDDGIFAPGIAALTAELAKYGEVYVAAPDHNCSANSHYLTMHDPIPTQETAFPGAVRAWAVGGTPADCVHLALSALLTQRVDLVVSGINRGPNLSTDCLYSGTVAAAMDAFLLGRPGLAVSLNSFEPDADYSYAACAAAQIALYMLKNGRTMVLNVNVPAVPRDKLRGIKLCTIDRHMQYPGVCYTAGPGRQDGQQIWQFVSMVSERTEPSADYAAVLDDYISVTPLTAYWSDAALLEELAPDFAQNGFALE